MLWEDRGRIFGTGVWEIDISINIMGFYAKAGQVKMPEPKDRPPARMQDAQGAPSPYAINRCLSQ